MKKGFGIFFIVIGSINILTGILGLPTDYVDKAAQQLVFGIGFLGLGIWMVDSANKKKKLETSVQQKSTESNQEIKESETGNLRQGNK